MESKKEKHERHWKIWIISTIALWIVSLVMLWAFFNLADQKGIGLILCGVLLLITAIGMSIMQIAFGIRSWLIKMRTAHFLGVKTKDIDYFDGHWFFPQPQISVSNPEFHEAMFDRSVPVEIIDHYVELDSSDDIPNPSYYRLIWKAASTGRKKRLSFAYGLSFIGLLVFFDRWHIPYTIKEISDHNRGLYENYIRKDATGVSERDREWKKYYTEASPTRGFGPA